MRILHLIDEPYDSGIVDYALTAAGGLLERGHDVTVAGLPGRPPLARARALGLKTEDVGGLPMGLFTLRRLLAAGAQVVNAHTGSSHAMAVAASRGLRAAPAVVRTRGDSRPPKARPGASWLWTRTAGFIAPTNAILGEFLRAFSGLKVRTQAILPGIPSGGGTGPETPVYAAGLVGRLDPVKGHSHFLAAASLLRRDFPDYRFAAAGREENLGLAGLRAQARGLGLEGRFDFLGHVPDASAFMRRCKVGVVASTGSEAVSRAAIEWMSAGAPLVASAVGCLPELVEDGVTGFLVPPGDAEAMTRRLAGLLRDEGLRRRMGAAARARYERLFTMERFIEETEQFYRDCLSPQLPRPPQGGSA